MTRVLRDEELRELVDLPRAVAALESGYRADARGEFVVLPRHRADAGGRGLAWLGGAIPARNLLGFRTYVYRPDGYDRRQQLVALYDHASLELRGLFVGGLVGNLRTGAAVAAALHLAEPGLTEVGMIGTGAQARHALACMVAAFPHLRVVAWSRDPGHRTEFRDWSERTLAHPVELAANARETVAAAPAIVLTTSSETTVVSKEMVDAPRLFVSIAAYRRPELDPRLFDEAELVWTDCVAQAAGPGTLFAPAGRRAKLRPLGEGVESGALRDRTRHRFVLNTGAAWEELLVGELLLEAAEARGRGTEIPWPEGPGDPGLF